MSTAAPLNQVHVPLLTRRARAYFAPVDRVAGAPTLFDPAVNGSFTLDAPPSPWVDLGWIDNFARQSGSKTVALNTGIPATAKYQVRDSLAATVSFRFKTWSKLSMALTAGSQHMNLLAPKPTGIPSGSGAKAVPALALAGISTATSLAVTLPSSIQVGMMVAVDTDYVGQTGFVGAGVSAAYVRNGNDVGNDPDYVRRVSFNVARVVRVSTTGLQLGQPLAAGTPAPGMKVQEVRGFVDREGGSFFQEWSALFVLPGEQGDRLLFHYPRLQALASAREEASPLSAPLESVLQVGAFRALPVVDINDGEQVLCFRTYIPGTSAFI